MLTSSSAVLLTLKRFIQTNTCLLITNRTKNSEYKRTMVNKSKIGTELPLYTFEVERVKIREMIRAIGNYNPIYINPEAAKAEGYADTPCPPTFLTAAFQEFTGAFFRAFNELGVDLANVLHGEEEYIYKEEVYPGDILKCKMHIESIIEKQTKSGQMNLITLCTSFKNQNGKEVVEARSLIIERK